MKKLVIGILNCNRGIEISLLLQSLLNQTYQDFDINIIDDNSNNFLYENTTVNSLFKLHENLNHKINIIKGQQKGPHFAGQLLLENSHHELILRLDDDVTLQSDCVEKLINCFNDNDIVAVGPIYLLPFKNISDQIVDLNNISDYDKTIMTTVHLINDNEIYVNGAFQMNILLNSKGNIKVQHLHSGFMYKKSALEKIDGYFLGYSKVSHREETDTSYRLFLDGGKLLICPDAIAFHFHPMFGGIRTDSDGKPNKDELWVNDDKLFIERFKNNFPMYDKYNSTITLDKISEHDLLKNENAEKIKDVNKSDKNKRNVHFVTVTHGNHEKLNKLIDSVFEFTKDIFSWSIINNDPTEESRIKFNNLIENLRNRFIYKSSEDNFNHIINYKNFDKEVSVSEARNIGAGMRPANTEYICFIDDDALILGKWSDDDWLDIMLKEATKELDIGAVGPIHTWSDILKSYV